MGLWPRIRPLTLDGKFLLVSYETVENLVAETG